jgi:hypothetical protein
VDALPGVPTTSGTGTSPGVRRDATMRRPWKSCGVVEWMLALGISPGS